MWICSTNALVLRGTRAESLHAAAPAAPCLPSPPLKCGTATAHGQPCRTGTTAAATPARSRAPPLGPAVLVSVHGGYRAAVGRALPDPHPAPACVCGRLPGKQKYGPFAGASSEAGLRPDPSPFSQSYTHNGQTRRCCRPIALAATVTSLLSIRLLPATATTRQAGHRWRRRTTPASTCWRVCSRPD